MSYEKEKEKKGNKRKKSGLEKRLKERYKTTLRRQEDKSVLKRARAKGKTYKTEQMVEKYFLESRIIKNKKAKESSPKKLMDEPPEDYRKNVSELFESLLFNSSQSSFSSNSSLISPIGVYGEMNPQDPKRSDYLSRLFEKKKLKEKSLSKKMKTPFDRKLYRTCWPVKLGKVTRIKKKPKEKKRKKPTHKSLKRKRIASSSLLNIKRQFQCPFINIIKKKSDDMTFTECLRRCHFMYEPITPQLLLDILKDPEHLESGATIETIISKLRAFKLHLNPAQDLLREELLQKLKCGVKLGLVIEKKGFFKVAEAFANKKLPKRKIDAFWTLWYRDVPCKKY